MAKAEGHMIQLRGKAARDFIAALSAPPRKCRYCSCTDYQVCPSGCTWTGEALCSGCTPDHEQTITALCLVSGTEHITDSQVGTWTPDQRADAFYWAMAIHHLASDNLVAVPPRPHAASRGNLPVTAVEQEQQRRALEAHARLREGFTTRKSMT